MLRGQDAHIEAEALYPGKYVLHRAGPADPGLGLGLLLIISRQGLELRQAGTSGRPSPMQTPLAPEARPKLAWDRSLATRADAESPCGTRLRPETSPPPLGVVVSVAGATSGAMRICGIPQGCGWGHRTQTCTQDTYNLVTLGPMAYPMPGTPPL